MYPGQQPMEAPPGRKFDHAYDARSSCGRVAPRGLNRVYLRELTFSTATVLRTAREISLGQFAIILPPGHWSPVADCLTGGTWGCRQETPYVVIHMTNVRQTVALTF